MLTIASIKVKNQPLNPDLSDNIGKAMDPLPEKILLNPPREIDQERVRLAIWKPPMGPCHPCLAMTACPVLSLPDTLSPHYSKGLGNPPPAAGPVTWVTMLPCPRGSLLEASRGQASPSAAGRAWPAQLSLSPLIEVNARPFPTGRSLTSLPQFCSGSRGTWPKPTSYLRPERDRLMTQA